MRTFATLLLVVVLLCCGAVVWFFSQLRFYGEGPAPWPTQAPVTTTSPSVPEPGWLMLSRQGSYGWDVSAYESPEHVSWVGQEHGTCADPYPVMSGPLQPDAGHSAVTLELTPQPTQEIVVTDVRVRVHGTQPIAPAPRHLVHCEGTNDRPVAKTQVEARKDATAKVPSDLIGQKIPLEGVKRDIDVTVVGAETANWQIELDYTINGVPLTKALSVHSGIYGLATEPVRTEYAGRWVWCAPRFRAVTCP